MFGLLVWGIARYLAARASRRSRREEWGEHGFDQKWSKSPGDFPFKNPNSQKHLLKMCDLTDGKNYTVSLADIFEKLGFESTFKCKQPSITTVRPSLCISEPVK